jgi:hypothetical protein
VFFEDSDANGVSHDRFGPTRSRSASRCTFSSESWVWHAQYPLEWRYVWFASSVRSSHSLTTRLVSFLGSLGATTLVMQRQALWLEAIERRIAATAAMLDSMKGVKMCGLTEVLRDDLQRLRVDELEISKGFRKLLIWTMMIC